MNSALTSVFGFVFSQPLRFALVLCPTTTAPAGAMNPAMIRS